MANVHRSNREYVNCIACNMISQTGLFLFEASCWLKLIWLVFILLKIYTEWRKRENKKELIGANSLVEIV